MVCMCAQAAECDTLQQIWRVEVSLIAHQDKVLFRFILPSARPRLPSVSHSLISVYTWKICLKSRKKKTSKTQVKINLNILYCTQCLWEILTLWAAGVSCKNHNPFVYLKELPAHKLRKGLKARKKQKSFYMNKLSVVCRIIGAFFFAAYLFALLLCYEVCCKNG